MKKRSSRRIRVLVVDEDVRTTQILARMLREDGFTIEVAADGAAAIRRLSRSPAPDVVVTDLMMAPVDGLAVARYARSRRPNLRVFFVTEHPELAGGAERALLPEPRIFAKPLDYAAFSGELSRTAEISRVESAP